MNMTQKQEEFEPFKRVSDGIDIQTQDTKAKQNEAVSAEYEETEKFVEETITFLW